MKKFVKAIAAIAAATICAVPMVNSMASSAGSLYNSDLNKDGKYDVTDYDLFNQYNFANNTTKESLKKKHPGIDRGVIDWNGDGIISVMDAEIIRFVYLEHSDYTYDDKADFIQNWAHIEVNGVERPAVVSGDVNGDLVFDVADAVALTFYLTTGKDYILHKSFERGDLPRILFNRSDYNHDKVLDMKDLDNMIYFFGIRDYTYALYKNRVSGASLADWYLWLMNKETIFNQIADKIDYAMIIKNHSLGDANGDGKTDMSDVVTIQQYLINPKKYPIAEKNLKKANVYRVGNSENKVTVEDMTALQLICNGWSGEMFTTIKKDNKTVFNYYNDINKK